MKTLLSIMSVIRLLTITAVFASGCSSSTGSGEAAPLGGAGAGAGASTAIGGGSNGGANSTVSVGGASPAGGAQASGGKTPTDGTATGGTSTNAIGGATQSGSTSTATGGKASTGGSTSATGGTAATNTGGSTSTGAAGSSNAPARCSTVTGAVAQALVTNGAILLDVRTASEFAANGLPGAINIAVTELATRMSELDKSKNIVVYCASGSRSGQANTQLCTAGYNVFNLGPLTNWPQ